MTAKVAKLACAGIACAFFALPAIRASAEGEAAASPTSGEKGPAKTDAAEQDTIAARPGPPPGQERPDIRELTIERKARELNYRVNTRISRYATAAMDTIDAGNPEEGLKLLARLNPKRLNPNERATIDQFQAMLYYSTGDLDKTIESFRRAIDEEILPIDQETKIRFNIAQLLAGLYRWEDAIEAIYDWFRWTTKEDPLAYYLLGIANFQLGNMDLAIVNTEKAIEIAPKPKEGWLQLLSALYVQDQNYKKAAPVLERLLTKFPKKQYWVQLALVYGALDKYQASLAVQQIAYEQGLLTEDKDLRRLARSYLYAELPYPAAKVLQKGIDEGTIEAEPESLELLANSWIAAREFERSLPPLLRAAKISEDGNLFVRLGQVHLQREEWGEAAESLKDAIDKGGLAKPGSAHLLLGIAYYNDGKPFRARSSFLAAEKFDSSRHDAKQWIQHLDKEATTS